MPVRYLLDTNIVSFHIRQSSPALRRHLAAVTADAVALSVVTEMEIRFGLERNPRLRIRPLVQEFLDGITILPMDSAAAREYARIRAELHALGSPIGPLDLMIAAHAASLRATLVTNDVSEFGRVRGLRVVDWTR